MTKADFESHAGDSIHIEVEIDFHALVVGENAFILVVLELLSVFGVLLRFVNAAELSYILAFLVFGFEDEAFGLLVVGNEFKSALHLTVGQVVAISPFKPFMLRKPSESPIFPVSDMCTPFADCAKTSCGKRQTSIMRMQKTRFFFMLFDVLLVINVLVCLQS